MVLVCVSSAAALGCKRAPGPSVPAFRNVVLISIDTCRPDYLSCYGYPRQTTPNIDAVAADGVLFTRAFTTNPMTLPAHSSMLTGTLPAYHGVHMNDEDRLADDNRTLAEMLRDQGYDTAAFVSAFVLDSIFGLNQGFNVYGDRFADAKKPGSLVYNQRRAEETSHTAMSWLEQHRDAPFFLFLHFFDPHQPYEPPAPFDREFADAPYAGEIAYTDRQIGLVIDKMKDLGLYDSTLLIVTSDHGEGLGEHGEETHSYFVYDSTIHIPLVIRMPGGARGVRVDDPVSVIDIAPTIAELAGLPRPERMTGQSLAASLRGQPAGERSAPIYFESLQPRSLACAPFYGIVDGRWKLVEALRSELYDMDADGETADVFSREPERGRDLQRRLAAIRAAERPEGADSSLPLDPSTQERLRALGYLAGDAQPSAAANLSDPMQCFAAFESFGKAQTYFQQNRYAEAEAASLAALSARPTYLSALFLLGTIALEQGRMGDAEQRFRAYLRVIAELQASAPRGSATHLAYATARVRNNLGNVLLARNRLDDAAAEYREALRLSPSFPEAHQNMGTVLESTGDRAGAIEEYRTALRFQPDFVDARKSLGEALKAARRWDEAAAAFDAALQLAPDDPDIHLDRAWVAQKLGNTPLAVEHYRRAVELRPDQLGCNNLAWLYATHWDESFRDAAQAVDLATRAAELTEFRDPNVLDTLAAAYASAGRFAAAIETTTRALALAETGPDGDLAGLHERLALYRSGKAYRQTPQ